jgi:glycosyltransferase involved in cell wall biosynthesis
MMTVEDFEPIACRKELPAQFAAFKRREAPATELSIVAIIPLYNGAKFIEDAIRSVWAQTNPADEVIVVDDGSTDDGPKIVERLAFEGSVRLLHKENGGQSSARNHGVACSTSHLIAFLDQDDIWYPNHLEEMLKAFRHHRGLPLGWVYSDLDEVDESRRMIRRSILALTPTEHPKRTLTGCLSHDMFVLPSASLISRKAFEQIGGFDERLSGYEDDDLFLRLFREGFDNIYLDKPLSQWRIYGGSTSYTDRMSRSRLIYIQKLLDSFPDDVHRGHHYRAHLIAPRFLDCIMSQYLWAVRTGQRAKMRPDDIKILLPYLSRKRRVAFAAMLPLMRSYRLAALIWNSPPFMRRVAARLCMR